MTGPVSDQWTTRRLKRAVDLVNQRADINASPYIGLEHVESWTGRLLDSPDESEPAGSTSRFQAGDILFGKLRPYLAKVVHASFSGCCSPEFLVLRPRVHDPRYLQYVLLTVEFIRRVDASTYGSKMPRANWTDIGAFDVPVPPLTSQHAIADFLDEKTAAIDALIAKKERLIDLIEEKRQAAITRAVTKGLDPDVPMKDSGVEWLGEVPAHWEVLPVRRVAHFFGGTGFPHAYQGQTEGSYPFFKVEDMNSKGNGWILTKAANYVSEAVSRELRATICPTGSVVFAKVGAALLKNRRRVLGQASIIDNNMLAAVPTGVRTKYFAHVLGLVDFGELRRPGPVPSITGGDVASIPIPIPPQSEQIAIEEHLDDLRRRNRCMVRLVSIQVERLREYRQTLISAAVSGQIDVRSRSTRTDEVLQEALS